MEFPAYTSSPYYPQSNGAAERAVRTAKGILKQDDIFLALLTYRSTPIPDLGVSPAELVMGRKLHISLPTLPSTLMPHTSTYDQARKSDHAFKEHQKQSYHHHHDTQPLSELHPGDPVLLKKRMARRSGSDQQKWCVSRATLLPPTPNGRELKRNRKHIRMRPVDKCPAACEQPNTIDMRSAPVDKRPAVNSQLQQATPAPDLSPQPASPGQTSPAEYPTHSGRAVRPPARFEE